MADLSVTIADVEVTDRNNGNLVQITLGETVTAGEPLYKATSGGKYLRAQADDGTRRKAEGICVLGGDLDSIGMMIKTAGAKIKLGATIAVGEVYVVSANLGKIAPIGDISTTGHYYTVLGIGATTTELQLLIDDTGIQEP